MTIKITIQTDNDAFYPDPGTEIARILREYADEITNAAIVPCILLDANGNAVGRIQVTGR